MPFDDMNPILSKTISDLEICPSGPVSTSSNFIEVTRHLLVAGTVYSAIEGYFAAIKGLFVNYDGFMSSTATGLRHKCIEKIGIWFYHKTRIELALIIRIDWQILAVFANDRPIFSVSRNMPIEDQVDRAIGELFRCVQPEVVKSRITKIYTDFTFVSCSPAAYQEYMTLLALCPGRIEEQQAQREFIMASEGLKLTPGPLAEVNFTARFASAGMLAVAS
jgi:hypothetical protein